MGRDSSVGIATRYGLDGLGSYPGGGEIFRTRPDRPWGPTRLLYNVQTVPFPGLKRPGSGVNHTPSSSAVAKERVELYLYSLSRPSWLVLGRNLPSIFTFLCLLYGLENQLEATIDTNISSYNFLVK